MLVFKDNSGKMWRFEPINASVTELNDFFDKQFTKYEHLNPTKDEYQKEDSIDQPPRFGNPHQNEDDYFSPEKQEKLLDDIENKINKEKMQTL